MKTAGLVMLMLGGIYLCFARISAIDRGLSGVRGLCELIRYAKRQIENYSMPCREIMRGCPREILDLCGYEREMPPEDFLELYYSLEISDSEADRIFFDFANDVGSSYRAEQVKRCEEFLALMSERERYIASRAPIEKKLVLTLSASALIAALILAL